LCVAGWRAWRQWVAVGVAVGLASGWAGAQDAGTTDTGDTAGNTTPALHTFTNSAGKSIKAEVVNVADDTVFLKRADGQSFKVDISALSKKDQGYVRLWAVQQAMTDGTPVFNISATSTKTQPQPGPNGTFVWTQGFKVKLSNQIGLHLVNPSVRYIIIMAPQMNRPTHQSGVGDVSDIPANGEVTFDTDKVSQVQHGTGSAPIDRKVEAVWVRVYDSTGKLMIQDWSSASDWTQGETWDFKGSGRPRHAAAPPPTDDSNSGGGAGDGGGGSSSSDGN
jgi:hypothetical protein